MKNDLVKMVLIGVGLAILLTCGLGGLSLVLQPSSVFIRSSKTLLITKLAVPTTLPSQIPSLKTADTTLVYTDGSMAIGAVVQISGTGNVGLKLRLSPGVDGAPQFVAMENEVFEIRDGPVIKDGITWWRLASSYDENRQGWAAGQYLTVFDQQ
jgi:hypothetical protein